MQLSSSKKRAWWSLGLWLGCEFPGWIRLLIRNRFDVAPSRCHVVVLNTVLSVLNSFLGGVQVLCYGPWISGTELPDQPLFIIGHWRTGTTLLHELLSIDERHSFPNTYQCLFPNHFLLTEWLGTRFFGFLIPSQRAMDNMPQGWEHPQEDEFALCNLGVPSPYLTMAFPNHPAQCPEYFDLEGISAQARELWKYKYSRFLKQVAHRSPKRLVLKSPPHTCRIKLLLELFPEAHFVHIVRNPYLTIPSTIHLWETMYVMHGLQLPKFDGLKEFVLENFTHMYHRLETTRHLINPARWYELRYEDLVADPVDQMRNLYDHLRLGEFGTARPGIERYVKGMRDYQTNRYELDTDLEAEIARVCSEQIRRYGYASPRRRAGGRSSR